MTQFFAPEPLTLHHRLEGFTCNNQALDSWLANQAHLNSASGASRVFVATDNAGEVAAYYSLSTGSVPRNVIPRKQRHGAPQPVPILIIGRFAVASRYQSMGLGRSLLQDALMRCLRLLDEVAFMFILVHPIDQAASAFWRHFGFVSAPTSEPMLLLPTSHLRPARSQTTARMR